MSTTATYLRHGRGRSVNAEAAMDSGRMPASHIAKAIGQGTTAAFVTQNAPSTGEWHHVGKYASRVKFFDLDTCLEWLSSDEGKASLAAYKAERKAARASGTDWIVADVVVTEWERVAINRFGKLAWRSHSVSIKEARCTVSGASVTITGYGRKMTKNVTMTVVTKAELASRKRKAAAQKAAATRRARAAEAAKAAAAPALIAQIAQACITRMATLALPRYATATMGSASTDATAIIYHYSRRWNAEGRGAVHPAPEAVMQAKSELKLSWKQIETFHQHA